MKGAVVNPFDVRRQSPPMPELLNGPLLAARVVNLGLAGHRPSDLEKNRSLTTTLGKFASI